MSQHNAWSADLVFCVVGGVIDASVEQDLAAAQKLLFGVSPLVWADPFSPPGGLARRTRTALAAPKIDDPGGVAVLNRPHQRLADDYAMSPQAHVTSTRIAADADACEQHISASVTGACRSVPGHWFRLRRWR
ncbi:hypothetical protein Ate01nite_35540 [Actinoplanes teichomyceticus]|nr:hypothetical protein Ate01nite_35540 [Actinoplanes teichomyceticus]